MSVSPTQDRGLDLLGSGGEFSSSDPSITPASETDDRLGMEIGKYVVTRRLGRGGMGIVYEAMDNVLRRKVAIKFFSETVAVTNEAVRRFVQEAQAAARLNHPNVVSVYEVGQHEGIYFLVMELVRGTSAEEHLKLNGPFNWVQATRVTASACRALAAAHAAQLIHRDIKPANLLLCTDPLAGETAQGWHVKLGDFGLAKLIDAGSLATAADRVLGTPNYMSPEQCRSEALDPRSDLYSLGATYYSLLTAKAPFACDQTVQVMFAHCWNPIPDPRETNPAIPESCAQIIRRAMAKDPHDRYRSAKEMVVSLDAALLEGSSSGPAGERFKATGSLDAGCRAQAGLERDGPPFSRPLDPALASDRLSGQGETEVMPPPRPSRKSPWIIGGLLLVAAGTIAGIIGWGRHHQADPGSTNGQVAGPTTPATGPANLPDALRWMNDAGGIPASVAFSPDGRKVIAAIDSDAGGIRGWESASGHADLTILQGSPFSTIAFPLDPDISRLFVGKTSEILQWSSAKAAPFGDPIRINGNIGAMAWVGSPTGKHVLAVQVKADGANPQARLQIFNEKLQEIDFNMLAVTDVISLCPMGGTSRMATGSTDTTIRLWAVNTLDLSHGYALLSTIENDVVADKLASSSDGTVLAAGSPTVTKFYSITKNGQSPNPGKLICTVSRPYHDCRSLAISPDGMTAAVGGGEPAGNVTIYDVNAGKMIAEITGFSGSVNALAFSPNGGLLAIGSRDHAVKVYDLQRLLPARAATSTETRPIEGRP